MTKLFKSQFKSLEIFGALSFLMVLIVQLYLRPAYGNQKDALTFFFGIAPNLFGGIGISISNFIYRNKTSDLKTKILTSGASAIGFLGIWEAIQFAGGRTFDIWDITASVAGASIDMLALWLSTRKMNNFTDLKIQVL